jgi:hypothetical protein
MITVGRWIARYHELRETQVAQIDGRLEAARAKVRDCSEVLRKVREARTVVARLPIERVTQKIQLILILRSNKAHWVPIGRASSLFPHPFRDVTVDRSPTRHTVTVRRDGGFTISPGLARHPRFRQLMSATDRRRHFFDLFVTGDSVAAFRHFKDAVLAEGYEYNVHPEGAKDTVVFGNASSVDVQ